MAQVASVGNTFVILLLSLKNVFLTLQSQIFSSRVEQKKKKQTHLDYNDKMSNSVCVCVSSPGVADPRPYTGPSPV